MRFTKQKKKQIIGIVDLIPCDFIYLLYTIFVLLILILRIRECIKEYVNVGLGTRDSRRQRKNRRMAFGYPKILLWYIFTNRYIALNELLGKAAAQLWKKTNVCTHAKLFLPRFLNKITKQVPTFHRKNLIN